MEIEVIAAKRDLQGTGASRRLRHAGKVPGIVYGGLGWIGSAFALFVVANTLWASMKELRRRAGA